MKNVQTLITDDEHRDLVVAALNRKVSLRRMLKTIIQSFLEKEKEIYNGRRKEKS